MSGKKWTTLESVLYYSTGDARTMAPKKLIMFDMDKTLIKPSSGAKFPKHGSDWKWCFEPVLKKLTSLVVDPDTRVVVISNQGWRSGREMRLARARSIVESWVSTLPDARIEVFLLTGKDRYRKPFPGVLDLLNINKNSETQMIYVGDAAGRPSDHSDSDIKFAYNAQIYLESKVVFMTPEQFFEIAGNNEKKKLKGFNPRKFMEQFKGQKQSVLRSKVFKNLHSLKGPEVILMVGPPGIGKSLFAQLLVKSFAKKTKKQFRIVSQDDYASGGARRAVKRMSELLETGYSIIVDNTHPDMAMRRRYIMAAEKYFDNGPNKSQIRAFVLGADINITERIELAKHMDALRVVSRHASRILPEVAYRMFKSRWKMPMASEGFCAVEKIKFIPLFKTVRDIKWFLMRF